MGSGDCREAASGQAAEVGALFSGAGRCRGGCSGAVRGGEQALAAAKEARATAEEARDTAEEAQATAEEAQAVGPRRLGLRLRRPRLWGRGGLGYG